MDDIPILIITQTLSNALLSFVGFHHAVHCSSHV